MGTYLSQPVLEKSVDKGDDLSCKHAPVSWACVDMQGWRKTMEDAHVAETTVRPVPLRPGRPPDTSAQGNDNSTTSEMQEDPPPSVKVFGVFDGHGGSEVAKFCQKHLVRVLATRDQWSEGDVGAALIETFFSLDRMIDDPKYHSELMRLKNDAVSSKASSEMSSLSSSPSIPSNNLALCANDDDEEVRQPPKRRGQKERIPNPADVADAAVVELPEDSPPPSESPDANDDMQDDTQDETPDETLDETPDIVDDNDDDGDCELAEPVEASEPSPSNEQQGDENEDANSNEEVHANNPRTRTQISEADAMILFQKLLTMSTQQVQPIPISAAVAANDQCPAAADSPSPNTNHNPATNNNTTEFYHENAYPKSLPGQLNSSMTLTTTPSRIQNGRQVCNLPDHPVHAGCTCVVVVMHNRTLTIANAGDSRAVLSRKGGMAVPLSFDHKPLQEREMSRIQEAGGFVNQFGRVNGNLNLSRSIGDLKYKQRAGLPPSAQMITAEPDIVQLPLDDDDEFFIIGCDGIWDCLSNEAAVNYVRGRIDTMPLTQIATQMLDDIVSKDPRATQGIGGDNMTCLIVDLMPHTRSHFNDHCNAIHGKVGGERDMIATTTVTENEMIVENCNMSSEPIVVEGENMDMA